MEILLKELTLILDPSILKLIKPFEDEEESSLGIVKLKHLDDSDGDSLTFS